MNSSVTNQEIFDFLRHLLSAATSASLYGMKHQQVERLVGAAESSLSHLMAGTDEISLMLIDGELVIDGKPQPFSLVLNRFAQFMQGLGVGHLRFIKGISSAELRSFVESISTQTEALATLGSSDHIKLGKVSLQGGEGDGSSSGETASASDSSFLEGGRISIRDMPAIEVDRLSEVYEAIKNKERLKPSQVASSVSELVSAFNREGDALLMMATIREKDEYTFTHVANVSILTIAQASALGISGSDLHEIGMAAMLHDIGKMFVPDEILNKTGALTDDEFAIMKYHPVRGARYLIESPGVPRLAPIVAYEHHMRYNLSGYPAAPKGWQMNLISQMTSLSDCYDAMRTKRPYSEPKKPREIFNFMLSRAGSDYNPVLLRNFIAVMAKMVVRTDQDANA